MSSLHYSEMLRFYLVFWAQFCQNSTSSFCASKPLLSSISSMFYIQLLHPQIPKAEKDTDDLTVFLMLLGSTSVKAARKMLMKLTPDLSGVQCIACSVKVGYDFYSSVLVSLEQFCWWSRMTSPPSTGSFAPADSISIKRQLWFDCLFALLGSAGIKGAHQHVGEIDPRSISFYEQLIPTQMPKAQKDSDNLTEFLCFWDLCV